MTVVVGARSLVKADAGVVHALLNARYYNSAQGQFISEDPTFLGMQQNLNDPQSLNSYSYANDNPITGKDAGDSVWHVQVQKCCTHLVRKQLTMECSVRAVAQCTEAIL
jgi:RHS repeat-associated protein